VVLSKLDGDARGGAALSVASVTGRPIMFASTGEGLDDFEPFYPDRMASRILDLGDILTLIEQAQENFDRALEYDPDSVEIHLKRAEARVSTGDIAGAHDATHDNVLPLVVHHDGTLRFNNQIAAWQDGNNVPCKTRAKLGSGRCLAFA